MTPGLATPRELAAATGTVERYVRGWLEQQAVAGFVTVPDPHAHVDERRYGLPADHRPTSSRRTTSAASRRSPDSAIGVLAPLDDLLAAYRGGAAELNRSQFLNLVADWLGSIPRSTPACVPSPPHMSPIACKAIVHDASDQQLPGRYDPSRSSRPCTT